MSSRLRTATLSVYALALCAPLIAYSYLGTFARHIADDYCSIHLIRGNFLANLWLNYVTISDRFSNFILISLSEVIWPGSVAALPAILLVLWVGGLVWLFHEATQYAGVKWEPALSWVLALLFVFHVVLMAPNRYQTLYWRASSAAHLAPLVLTGYLAAFLFRELRLVRSGHSGKVAPLLAFVATFFIGDFSEPLDTILILSASVGLAWLWLSARGPHRRASLVLMVWTFAGAVAALVVMAVSPANALRLDSPPPPLPVVLVRSFQYALIFVRDTLRVLPLPALLAFLSPLCIFWLRALHQPVQVSAQSTWPAGAFWLAAPLCTWILIAASFSPSVFGQGFPLERARIAGLACLIACLVFLGAFTGSLLSHVWPAVRLPQARIYAPAALLLLAVYPIRAAWLAMGDADVYAQRARAWDARQEDIYRQRAAGEKRLIITQFDGLEGIKELDVYADHWTNRCAAAYYSVDSVRALPPDGP